MKQNMHKTAEDVLITFSLISEKIVNQSRDSFCFLVLKINLCSARKKKCKKKKGGKKWRTGTLRAMWRFGRITEDYSGLRINVSAGSCDLSSHSTLFHRAENPTERHGSERVTWENSGRLYGNKCQPSWKRQPCLTFEWLMWYPWSFSTSHTAADTAAVCVFPLRLIVWWRAGCKTWAFRVYKLYMSLLWIR